MGFSSSQFYFYFLFRFLVLKLKGSKRWIDLYLLPRFQPIELVKTIFNYFISIILSSEKYSNIYFKYLLSFLITIMIVLLLALQPDIGQTLLILFTWSILIFTSGINIIFLSILFLVLVLCLSYLIIFVPKFSLYKK